MSKTSLAGKVLMIPLLALVMLVLFAGRGAAQAHVQYIPLGPQGANLPGGNNTQPQLTSIQSSYPVVEHQRLRFSVTGIDPDGDPLSFSLGPNAPAGATLSLLAAPQPSHQTWQFSLTVGVHGSYPVSLRVSDGTVMAVVPFTVQVAPGANAVELSFETESGTAPGSPWNLSLRAPTMPGAPFVLLLGNALPAGVPLSGIFGTGLLGLDPASVTILLDGLAPLPFNPFTSPFQIVGTLPPGLTGLTMSFQAFLVSPALHLFTSPVASVSF